MSRSQLPLNALRAFEAAARHASFTHAAEELHVTQAAVSHQVKALEERLGVALFVRRPRGLEITGEGQALLPDLRDAFDRMTNALERVGRKANSGTLNVSLVTTFALGWLAPRLHRFQAKHPEIEVRMTTALRRVDFAREDFGCAIPFAVPALPADRRLRQGLVVRLPARLGRPAQDARLRGMAGRGAQRPAEPVGPPRARRHWAALNGRS